MAERLAFSKLFIGIKGSGKTHNAKKFLNVNERNLILPANEHDPAWQDKKFVRVVPEKKPIIDPTDVKGKRQIWGYKVPQMKSFKGNMKLILEEHSKIRPIQFEQIITNSKTGFNNGLIIIDDFRNYIYSKGQISAEILKFFINGRHVGMDTIMCCHNFSDVSGDFLKFKPDFYIHETAIPPSKSVLDKIGNSDELLETIKRVNRKNAQLPSNKRWYFEKFEIKFI